YPALSFRDHISVTYVQHGLCGSMRMSSAIIVIPCYNEAQRLPIHAFKAFVGAGHSHRFLFVNDGSTDGTLHVLRTLRDADPERYALCDLPRNVGKAEAVRTVVLRAFAAGPDYI